MLKRRWEEALLCGRGGSRALNRRIRRRREAC